MVLVVIVVVIILLLPLVQRSISITLVMADCVISLKMSMEYMVVK